MDFASIVQAMCPFVQPATNRSSVYNRASDAHYCKHCFEHLPHCAACGGAGHNGYQRHDGRFICAQCHETAVYDLATANNLYRRVMAVMSYHLGMRLKLRPALILVDRNQMLEILKQTSGQQLDKPEQVFGMFVQRPHYPTAFK